MRAKHLIILYFFTFVLGCSIGAAITAHKGQTVAVRCDTVFTTIHDTVPQPITRRTIRYISIPADTVHDTVYLPIEQKEYLTPNYHAWVSGYAANLDSITIRQQVITRTVVKKHRWGAGIATGYGINGPYIGIGIHYNILSW